MNAPTSKRVLLGVTGGIAAYKSAELVRRLRERGCEVRVVMTRGACGFVTPLTFQALSGNPVSTELLDEAAEAAMGHIELARWAELVLVAPATAHFMARLANGFADDLLSTLCLATAAPITLAPAMNQQMWRAPATRDNAALLAARGVRLLGPAQGEQACGDTGPGRMVEPEALADAVAGGGALAGRSVLITAGPTREPIDPVRFISNHSSGKMGFAVARAAAEAGARVTLVSGPTSLDAPPGVERVDVETTDQMYRAVMERLDGCHVFVGVAAVADYGAAAPATSKIQKREARMTLELARTRDILAAVAAEPRRPFTVGFAAETDDVEANALAKLDGKRLDMIAANRVGGEDSAFGAEENALTVYWAGGCEQLARAPKPEVARALVGLIAKRLHEKGTAEDP